MLKNKVDSYPKVSVITVVYNGVGNIYRTIKSIAEQTYQNIEYVIVDGGSTDGTLDQIIKNIELIDRWVSEPDNGIYDAMNKSIALTTGDFLIFMNAGDEFYSADVIESSINKADLSVDVIYGNHWTVGSLKNDGLSVAKPASELKYGMICSHQSMFFKRDVFDHKMFSLNYGTAADFELICFLYSNGYSFNKIDELIAYYHAGGVSDTKRVASSANTFRAALNNRNWNCSSVVFSIYCIFRACVVSFYDRINGRG